MTYKLEKTTKQFLVSIYEETKDIKKYPLANSISLILRGCMSPADDGTSYYPLPVYETAERLPLGDEYKIGQIIDFDGLKIAFTLDFQEEVGEGGIYEYKGFIRVLPLAEFDDRYLIDGKLIDIDEFSSGD